MLIELVCVLFAATTVGCAATDDFVYDEIPESQ